MFRSQTFIAQNLISRQYCVTTAIFLLQFELVVQKTRVSRNGECVRTLEVHSFRTDCVRYCHGLL